MDRTTTTIFVSTSEIWQVVTRGKHIQTCLFTNVDEKVKEMLKQ